ncbi:ribonuclease VapC [Acrocarpospora pleiomorpha]|uniref:Ribonuclease VapC n=1 Tax=Acrocarpospora pleiomorpha TaxID=90975 RepID=A0A5M3XW37_9ACTN|nr:type II toxin-antitoxin system VapC family toxin [Acrocarpospora pleiomorpha]GES23761.1 ribonuclease VapC [Acrocarpospora pleiomorpha]
MIYLLDTNVVAELTTRPKPDPNVIAWFRAIPTPNLYLSVLTVAEIEAGVAAVADPVRRARYGQALAQIRIDYQGRIALIGEREAGAYLAIHKTLKRAGTSIDPPDALIGATAVANNWTLATRNTKHLARTGARVENPWEDRSA